MDRENASIVAVIDHDDAVRDVLRTRLDTAGHDVETFKSGTRFLTCAQRERMIPLVVGQRMPRMTGLELLLGLERCGRPIPALPVAGVHDPKVKQPPVPSAPWWCWKSPCRRRNCFVSSNSPWAEPDRFAIGLAPR